MGERIQEALKLQFNRRLRLESHGARITSDTGLLACRELDEAMGPTQVAPAYRCETRSGMNVQHELVPLLRQAVYSHLANYEDTNDVTRLARDPAIEMGNCGLFLPRGVMTWAEERQEDPLNDCMDD